ncbi:conserved unknown protein [Ectocarpus siliculosus]|uniref:Flagellar associated protein n=1 Tax=Ectocarpus siliculosus TaxID=2880 RepID=D8LR00_ECTSI|nr:conserved unknown protein [Ectocarpus siliculosus]|eukprot:CBN77673.1 conserved unknown protein [Ectocarpus siliculosus]
MESHIKSVLNFEHDGNAEHISSPRSLEACLRSGCDPQDLMPRSSKTFAVKGELPELTEIRHNFFEARRKEKIAMVKKERQSIINFLSSKEQSGLPALGKSGSGLLAGATAASATDVELEARRIKAGILEIERKRGLVIAERQEKEMQRVVENEQRMADLHKKILRVEEADAKRRAEHDQRVAQQRAAAAEKRAKKEMEKHEREKMEDEQRKEMIKRAAEAEARQLKIEKELEEQRIAEAAKREEERRALKEQQDQATAALIRAQEEKAEEKNRIMAEREARVQAQLDEKKAAKAAEVAAQRASAEQRIQEVMEKNRKIQQDKKIAYDLKVAEVARRKAERTEGDEAQAKKRAEDQAKQDNIRAKRLEASYQDRADHRKDILARRRQKDKFYGQIRNERCKDLAMKKLYHDLVMEDKRQNIERLRRVDEFVRLQTLLRIEQETERTEKIKAEREFLVEQRIAVANKAIRKKHKIKEAMEKMRATNNFHGIDALLDGLDKRRRKSKGTADTEPAAGTAAAGATASS